MFVRGRATILHADLDAFFASVEQRDDPRLRGRPVIVGGGRRARGELRGEGARRPHGDGRPARAPALPDAIVVPPRMEAYSEASKAVFRVFEDTTPLVEGLSIDEAFLDVRGMERLAGTPAEIAARLSRDVRERVGLPITVGWRGRSSSPRWRAAWRSPTACSSCRPTASSRSSTRSRSSGSGASGRSRPGGCTGSGIATVGQVAGFPETALVRSSAGRRAAAPRARPQPRPAAGGAAPAPRRLDRLAARARSEPRIGRGGRRGPRRPRRPRDRRMRTAGRVGRTVVLRLRFDDFSRATRSHTLPRADRRVADDPRRRCGSWSARPRRRSRAGADLVGISVDEPRRRAHPPARAAVLGPGWSALDAALDEVRDRYGADAVRRGVLLGRDTGIAMPLLPD